MQPLACLAHQCGEALLYIEMDILGVERPLEFAGCDLAGDRAQALLDRREVLPGEDAAGGKHLRVRERRGDVMLRQPLVERYGSREALDLLVDRLSEAAGPGLRLLRHSLRMRLNTAP